MIAGLRDPYEVNLGEGVTVQRKMTHCIIDSIKNKNALCAEDSRGGGGG